MKLLPALGLHTIKLLPTKIIDSAGRKKKLLPIEFIGTSHNSVSFLGSALIAIMRFQVIALF